MTSSEDGQILETPQPDSATAEEKNKERSAVLSFFLELPVLIVIALVLAVLVKSLLVQAFYIPSGSMEDTLQINDRVLVSKLSLRFGEISRGDIIVFDQGVPTDESLPAKVIRNVLESVGLATPQSDLIKRVIALPHERIEIRDNAVFVNGQQLFEPYLKAGTRMSDFDEMAMPAGHYFVMGDNRNQSLDSRVQGPVPKDRIVGRAFVIMWPPSRWGGL